MYIWILLATIMISLSFFNLSPRADKDGVYTEVKATSLITRFKIEHSAFFRVAECKLLNSNSSGGYDPQATYFDINDNDDNKDLWLEQLPIGYQQGADLTAYHYTYCTTDDIAKGGSPDLHTCVDTTATHAYRYAVSFARLPDRWLSKNSGTPLPTLSNALAKLYVKGTILGIANCSVSGGSVSSCTFQGTESYVKELNAPGRNKTGYLSFSGSGGFYSNLFSNGHFVASCGGSCFFAIHRLSNHDVDGHCNTLGYNS